MYVHALTEGDCFHIHVLKMESSSALITNPDSVLWDFDYDL